MLNRTSKVVVWLVLLLMTISAIGCTSSRKEELHLKLQQGEQLLDEEKYEYAYEFYGDLLEDYQDNLTVMEKIDYAKVMKNSRINLTLARQAMTKKDFRNVASYLKEIAEVDEKGIVQKEEIIAMVKAEYLKRAEGYLGDKSYQEAMDVLGEYGEIMGDDQEITKTLELVLLESKKPVEIPKKVVVIDATHQETPNLEKEPIGPDSEVMESKVTQGTQGVKTKVKEYELNLAVALRLKQLLLDAGYEVYLTRETSQVNLSNIERTNYANSKEADLFLRLHGNSSKDSKKKGIEIIYPSKNNPYVASLSEASALVSSRIFDEMLKTTGATSQGVLARDNMAEHNFSLSPVTTILMGYMSNKDEDILLQTPEYQQLIAEGIKNGIKAYFEN